MEKKISPEKVFAEYSAGEDYNRSVGLYEDVKRNEDFYIGDQWKGVHAPELEKPVINFLKRTVSYLISMIVSDDVGVEIKPAFPDGDAEFLADTISGEVEKVIEKTKAKTLAREMLRNCAVDGDGIFYLWYEPQGGAKGRIRIDNMDNTKVIFGNPHITEVEEQPYIMLVRRKNVFELRDEAKTCGAKDWESIVPDSGSLYMNEDGAAGQNLVTEVIRLWKENGTVHFIECTRNCEIRRGDTGLYRYPVAWMRWDSVKNSYHGKSAISGVIPNQIFVNKLWAMAMEHEKRMAFPKLFYDMTKIRQWTNKVGQAIGVAGDPNTAVAANFRPADMSSQVMELVEKTISYTKECIGATDVALGNVPLDNTSAIIALQNAASAPLAIQKLAFYQFWEDCVLIITDMIRAYYGKREVYFEAEGEKEAVEVDFSAIDADEMNFAVNIGAASYWSELLQVETADSLYKNGIIGDAITYLESVPDKYIRNKSGIVEKLRRQIKEAEKCSAQNAAQPCE